MLIYFNWKRVYFCFCYKSERKKVFFRDVMLKILTLSRDKQRGNFFQKYKTISSMALKPITIRWIRTVS